MKRFALVCCFLSLACARPYAASAQVVGENLSPPSLEKRDTRVQLPKQVEREEVDRRGAMVEQLGTINDGPIDLIADAMKPPANDSDKWFIFLITKDGDKTSETLKQHFAAPHLKDLSGAEIDNPLQSWVKPSDPLKSYAHYNVLRIEDGEQQRGVFKDWFKGVLPALEKGFKDKGAPAIIMQPPKNGKYGENKIVVAMLFGYDGHPESLAAKLRYAQHSYIATLIKSGKLAELIRNQNGARREFTANENGLSDSPAIASNYTEVVGAAQLPPFNSPTAPINPLMPMGPGVDIPPTTQYLSLAQLQQLLQGAPAEYIMKVAATNPTMQQANAIQMQWLQDKAALDKQKDTTVLPSFSWIAILNTLLGGTNILALVGIAVVLWRQARQKSGQKVLLEDAQFFYILQALGIPVPQQPHAASGGVVLQNLPALIVQPNQAVSAK
jgi:hypothetical protein